MHQVVSRYSNLFLILPPEILGIILSNMDSCVVSNIKSLTVSKDTRDHVLSSIRYITRLEIADWKMFRIFTGVKRLIVLDSMFGEYNGFLSLSEKACNNLTSLTIPTCMVECLSEYFMPNLRFLEMISDCKCANEDIMVDPNPRLMPSLKYLVTIGGQISNISEFETLDVLDLSYVEIEISKLNKLNISELMLRDIQNKYKYDITKFNIPSLRKLTIQDEYFDISILEKLNISELILRDIDDCSETDIINIPSIETLTIDACECILDLSRLSKLKTLSIRAYDISTYKVQNLETLNVENLIFEYTPMKSSFDYQKDIPEIMMNFPNIKRLNVVSRVIGDNPNVSTTSYKF